ncbi:MULTISPECIES: hypothetical protein [Nocardia]|uniref:hypothetical protein n=1 Tax=Nocardia TaxID=1817 RepID=UPI002492402F|nr:hypothetical protein [Nocardia sputorum]
MLRHIVIPPGTPCEKTDRVLETTAMIRSMRDQFFRRLQPGLQFGQLATGQARRVRYLCALGGVVADSAGRRVTRFTAPHPFIGGTGHCFGEGPQRLLVSFRDGVPRFDQATDSREIDLIDLAAQRGDVVPFELIRLEDFPWPKFALEAQTGGPRAYVVSLLVIFVLHSEGVSIRLDVEDPVGNVAEHRSSHVLDRWVTERIDHQRTCSVVLAICVAFSMSCPVIRLNEIAMTSRMFFTVSMCSRMIWSIELESPTACFKNFLTRSSAILKSPKPETFCALPANLRKDSSAAIRVSHACAQRSAAF